MAKRTSNDKCLLCKTRLADKTGSHIITSFLTKSVSHFKRKSSDAGLLIVNSSNNKFLFKEQFSQSTGKESYLFCTHCEKRFECVETYIANKFYRRFRDKAFKSDFPISVLDGGDFMYATLSTVDPGVFSLFAWMQLWRSAVSTLEDFGTLKIGENVKEELRIYLDIFLKSTQVELISFSERKRQQFIPFIYGVFVPEKKFSSEFLFISAASDNMNGPFTILAGDILFVYHTLDSLPSRVLGRGHNDASRTVEVVIQKSETWLAYNNELVRPFPITLYDKDFKNKNL